MEVKYELIRFLKNSTHAVSNCTEGACGKDAPLHKLVESLTSAVKRIFLISWRGIHRAKDQTTMTVQESQREGFLTPQG